MPKLSSGSQPSSSSNGHGTASSPSQSPFVVNEAVLRSFERIVFNEMSLRRETLSKLFDPRRNIYDECGYPRGLPTVQQYQDLYDREAIAARVIQVFPKECWQVHPEVYEVEDVGIETPFETAWKELGKQLLGTTSYYQDLEGSPIWEYLRRADELSGIGRYGILLLGIDDGKPLDQPADFVDGQDGLTQPDMGGDSIGGFDRDPRLPQDHNPTSTNPTDPSNPSSPPTSSGGNKGTDDSTTTKKKKKVTKVSGPPNRPVTNRIVPQPAGKPRGETEPKDPNASTNQPNPSSPAADPTTNPEAGAGTGMMEEDGVEGVDGINDVGDQQAPFGDDLEGISTGLPTRKLLFIRVFPETLAAIGELDGDIQSPRFGQPLYYNITLSDPQQSNTFTQVQATQTVKVHWTRVIHIADNRTSSEVYGVPRLQAVLNNILGLQKLYCGSPEMYWKGAFFGLSIESHPDLGVDVQFDETAVKSALENYMNGLQRYLNIVGANIKTLAPQVVDPTPMIVVQLQAIAIKLGMPMRILMGSERGELASSQDDAAWNDRVRERERGYITPWIIVPLVDRLVQIGVLPRPRGYSIWWPDLASQTDTEKANVALTRTQALVQYAGDATTYMAPLDYLVHILKLDEAEAAAIIERASAEKALREQENMAKGLNPDGSPKMEMTTDENGNPVFAPQDPNSSDPDSNPNPDNPFGGGKGSDGPGMNGPSGSPSSPRSSSSEDLPGNAGKGKKKFSKVPPKKPIMPSNQQK